jgi:FkbM family methyltransferase
MISRLQWLLGRLCSRVLSVVFRRRWHRALRRIGTAYGGWYCDPLFLQPGGAVICAGAGEDISFDVALNRTYGVRVICVDPTPRAVAHVRRVLDCAVVGQAAPIDDGQAVYELQGFSAERFHLYPVALWDKETTIRLFAPSDASHVSHSVLNLQRTQTYIDVPARRIESIAAEHGAQRLALLKLDIEGAEYAVIDDLLAGAMRPDQLLVEFDELHGPASLAPVWRVATRIRALRRCGYRLVKVEHANFVFVFANDR